MKTSTKLFYNEVIICWFPLLRGGITKQSFFELLSPRMDMRGLNVMSNSYS